MDDRMEEFLHKLHPNALFEVRALMRRRSILTGYYDDPAKVAADVAGYYGQANLYVTFNQPHPDCRFRAYNKLKSAGPGDGTKDNEIIRRTAILIDFDPVRIPGIASTDAEHHAAEVRAIQVRDYLRSLGWADPLRTDSGNGAGLLYRVDLATDDGGLNQRVLKALNERFGDDVVKIDLAVHNASRVTRLVGTLNCKGENSPERPHRTARLVEAPVELLVVTTEQLEALLGGGPPAPQPEFFVGFDVAEFLESRGMSYTVTEKPLGETPGRWFNMAYCPTKGPGHTDGHSGIFQSHDGAVTVYRCHHEKCRQVTIEDVLRQLDPGFDQFDKIFPEETTEGPTDPHRLARVVLQDYEHPEQRTIMLAGGDFYMWDQVWSLCDEKKVKRKITPSIKAECDRYARERKRQGEKVVTPPVTINLTSNVLAALSSMVEVKAEPGSWIVGDGPAVEDLMVSNNGIIDLTAFAEGREYMIPHTPRFFATNRREIDFLPDSPRPTRWLKFLDELFGDDEVSRALLQDFFGYCLTSDMTQQKLLLLQGPPRAGKGVVTRILEHTLGRQSTCSIRLNNLPDRFALQQAVGKSLILVPDAKMPPRHRAEAVVELLKGIVGCDTVDIDRKHMSVISVQLPTKIVISSNHILDLPDDSSAFFERTLLLKLTNTFKDNPDTKLEAKLREELPGILMWAVEGWKRLRKRGRFVESEAGRGWKGVIQRLSSPIQHFVEECCDVGPNLSVDKAVIFDHWQQWSIANGIEIGKESEFAKMLYSAVPTVGASKRRVEGTEKREPIFRGIALKKAAVISDHGLRAYQGPEADDWQTSKTRAAI